MTSTEQLPGDSQTSSGHRLASAEREDQVKKFENTWTAPQRLRKHHKKNIKQYKSWKQGYDGTVALCIFCKRLFPIDTLEVHHHDHIISNNKLDNLDPACDPCNNTENAQALGKRLAAHRHADQHQGESEKSAPTHTEGQGSPELVKHNSMRPRYDRWVRDLVNGPFAHQYSWPRDLLAEKAPYACSTKLGEAFGSSKTYLKFIKEDAAFGLLITELREGIEIVMLNKDMLQRIQEKTGQ